MKYIIFCISLISLLALSCSKPIANQVPKDVTSDNTNSNDIIPRDTLPKQTIDFSELNPVYKFSGQIDSTWEVDYVANIESINVYDPSKIGTTNLDKSIIFIRHFSANSFLTLSTVDILSREDVVVDGRAAVKYEIKKKPGVANFPSQPLWRSQQHKLIDIRHSKSNPSEFYVIAYNPELSAGAFEEFINSLQFE